ncbi:hypothetical protein AB4071_07630 [Stenotrophomonas sp. 2MCAF14_2]|uniref:hypothetical protein n=1 Tax=Stenotrophomonas sp. 2MCAF14_2 TaxID=3232983 RepID=UPI001ED7B94E|nr:hypothetical protein [Stenotrophomonas maltophilia]
MKAKAGRVSAVLPAIVEVKDCVNLADDGLDAQVDPTPVAMESTSAADVAGVRSTAQTRAVVARLSTASKLVDVRMGAGSASALNRERVADLPVRAVDGHVSPLSRAHRSNT